MKHCSRPFLVVTVLLVFGICLAPIAQADLQHAEVPADVAAWLALMPELATEPAPAWLRPGVRLTYHVMTAAREGDTTPAGESVANYDVVSTDAGRVVAALGISVISGGALASLRDAGFVVGAPGAGDVWLHPSVLPTAERRANASLTIAHVPATMAGKPTTAVRFEAADDVSRKVSVFDESTGILVYRIQTLGNLDTAKQNSVMMEFISVRQMEPAWVGGSVPAWAQVGTQLVYEGSTAVSVGYGSPVIPMPTAMLARIVHVEPTLAVVQVEQYLNGMKSGEMHSVTSAAAPLGGIFLPPEALATLKPGQVLDRDPFTGVTVSVPQNPVYIDGQPLLALLFEGASFQRLFAYDRQSGTLVYLMELAREGIATTRREFKLTGVRRG